MKTTLALIAVGTMTVGCTTYPKNYTYNPTVTVNGDNVNVALPGPFSKTSPTINSNVRTSSMHYEPQPSPLTAIIPRPPVSAQYYYDPEESIDDVVAFVDHTTSPADLDQELSELIPH